LGKDEQKRILISRPDRLGDVVLSTPLPREIKKAFPDSFVAVMVRNYAKPVFENNPYVDEIITIDDFLAKQKGSFWRALKKLRSLKFNYALMLLPNERINYLLFAAGIKTRVGVGHKFFQWITNVKSVSRNKYKPLRHEADYCLDLARAIGVNSFNYRTEIFLSQEEKNAADKFRDEIAPNGEKIVGVHITSGNSCPNFSPSDYLKLIGELKNIPNFKIVITDVKLPGELESKLNGVIRIKEGMRNLFIALSTLDLLISSSTGPSHAAAALGISTLTLFCRISACSPQLWSPIGNDAHYIQPNEDYCANQCPGDPKVCTFANGGILPEQVVQKAKGILSE
jgi:ADP-heptose:LPS heptosyltransferase